MSDIERLEAALGGPIPEEYRRFLLGGGDQLTSPFGYQVPYLDALGEQRDAAIQTVYRLSRGVTVEFMIGVYRSRSPGDGLIPSDMIPVASLTDDNRLMIGWRGPRAGRVFIKDFWQLEDDGRDEPEAGVVFFAASFDQALARIQPATK